jgi:S1-C subfamily serine protease
MHTAHLLFTATAKALNLWLSGLGAMLRPMALLSALLACHLGSLAQNTPPPAPPLTAPPITPSPSVSWGTGFVVAEGYLLTAHHVVKGRSSILVGPVGLGPTGQPRWVLAQVTHTDPALDLALLKARIDLPPLPLHPETTLPLGLEISVIGYPQPRVQGMSKKITQGILNGYRNDNVNQIDTGYMQISAEVSMGNSGGPVIGPDGTVVGLVLSKVNAPKVSERTQDFLINVGYAVRSSALLQFLDASQVVARRQTVSLNQVLRPYQLFEQTQGSVLAVIGRGTSP